MTALNQLELTVTGNFLKFTSDPKLASGSRAFDKCVFTFNSAWDDFQKTAVFSVGSDEGITAVIENGQCFVPSKCLEKAGLLRIGVIGKNGNTVISTNIISHRISSGANDGGNII